ncbi:MAG: flavodoxin domain-containing protein, partial [Thermoproteota archaeon]
MIREVKILIVYDSYTGNTEEMAKAVAEGAENAGAKVTLKKVDDVTV